MAGTSAQPGSTPPVMFRAGDAPPAAAPEFVLARAEFASAATAPGILLCDISEYQPNIADAAYLRWSRAVAIRALYGTTTDRAWYGGGRRDALHAGGARFVALYQYLTAGQSGGAQARAFRQVAGPIRPGEVFVADFEEGAKPTLTDWYNTMLALYGPAIRPYLWTYSGEWFAGAQGALPVDWIAKYGGAEPSTPHRLWQFSPSYPVPGVGVCDCNLFRGTIGELAELAWQGTPATPPPVMVPPLAANWAYGPPQNLAVTPGHHNFHAAWEPPAGAPAAPEYYLVWVYEGTACSRRTLMPDYPRAEPGTATSPDPGSLLPGTGYTVHVAAFGAGGTHTTPGVYASATFTTGG